MPKRKIALHGIVRSAPVSTVQKYVVTIIGELADTPSAKDAKLTIFKAVNKVVKEVPGAQEFWVGQPRGPRKNGGIPRQPRPTRATE